MALTIDIGGNIPQGVWDKVWDKPAALPFSRLSEKIA
jgi:hypothetical protein